jgi:hypothetical protein
MDLCLAVEPPWRGRGATLTAADVRRRCPPVSTPPVQDGKSVSNTGRVIFVIAKRGPGMADCALPSLSDAKGCRRWPVPALLAIEHTLASALSKTLYTLRAAQSLARILWGVRAISRAGAVYLRRPSGGVACPARFFVGWHRAPAKHVCGRKSMAAQHPRADR